MLKQKIEALKREYDTEYVCTDSSRIFFGKFKGQNHSVLKDDLKYCEWILSTEEGFAESTKTYIRDNILK